MSESKEWRVEDGVLGREEKLKRDICGEPMLRNRKAMRSGSSQSVYAPFIAEWRSGFSFVEVD
jgi:hypothetical protein